MIIVPIRDHREKDQEDRSIFPIAIPNGIPIIMPNPTRNEGVIAISGFPAREISMMIRSSPNKRRGFIIRLTKNNGLGKRKFPVDGIITDRFTASKITTLEITEII